MIKKFRKAKNEKGVELIEFAMVLPLLILLCLGIIEFGRAFFTYHQLTKALRDGARYAATSRMKDDGSWGTDSTVLDKTRNVVVYGKPNGKTGDPMVIPDLQPGQISVTPSMVSVPPTEYYVTVSASYPYKPLFKLFMPTTIPMKPSAKMLFIGQIIFSY